MSQRLIDLNGGCVTKSISIPAWLDEMVSQHCKERDINKSNFIARALKRELLSQRYINSQGLWERLYYDSCRRNSGKK